MSAERPTTVRGMIAWLRAHPDDPCFSIWSKDRLLIGTRNDDGDLCAWECEVEESALDHEARPPESEGDR